MPVDSHKIGQVICKIIEHLPSSIQIERIQIVCRVGYKEVKYGVSPREVSVNDSEHLGKLIAEHITRDLKG